MTAWRDMPELVRDGVGSGVLVLVFIIAQPFNESGGLLRAGAVILVMAVAVTARRRWPIASYAAGLLTVLVAATGIEFLAVVSYTAVAYRERVRPAPVACLSAVALLIGHLQHWPHFLLDEVAGDLILIAGASVLPAALGKAVRDARRANRELKLRNAELVALRQQAADHAVETERFRIARELHDVVAHHISAMTVRATAGLHVAARDPQAAVDALAYVAEAGREALEAMGAFVGTLRGRQEPGDSGGLAPQPSLQDVPALLESFRRTGLVVHAELETTDDAVAPAVGLSAYRIVQEALTNAIRHGSAERAWVRMSSTGDTLHVQIDDNGRGLTGEEHPAGHGLVGMAERAAMHGGDMSFGPSPRGGCQVTATLVLDRPASARLGADAAPAST